MNDKEKLATGRKLPAIVAGTTSLAVLTAFGVQAQEQGGALATFGLSFGGEYEFNDPGENESSFTTGFSFDLSSVTRTQSFGLSTDARLVFDEYGFEFENPGLDLDYAWANRSTAFDVGLSYSIRDVDGEREVIDPVTGIVSNLIDDDGTLETVRVNAGLETGRDAPFGTDTRFSFTDRTYSDTSDPDLSDLESWQIGTTLRFDVDPRISLRSSVSYRETQEDDAEQTESRTTRFGVGGTFLIDPLWTASFDLGYSRFETEEEDIFGNRFLTEEDGVGASLSVTRQFRDGTLGLALAREVSDIGAEDSLRIFRNRALANGGELSWSLGLVSFPSGDTRPVASASYAMPTPRGSFSVSLDQATAVNSDDDTVISTSITLDYDQAINRSSGWSLNGSLSSVDVLGDDADDQSRAELGVAYNHALTRDWNLSTALSHRITYEGDEEDSSASILSVSLERSFSLRP
jgi:hypothetical protein